MPWTIPEYSRSRVDFAGKVLAASYTTPPTPPEMFFTMDVYDESVNIVNNWRSSHSRPLQIMKMNLLSRARSVYPDALVAQRIKRIPAIVFKLNQNRKMQLSQMQDIGGCRAVVQSSSHVYRLLDVYMKATAKNARRCGEFVEKYDYIAAPKLSGYRGIHLVYKYRTESEQLKMYDGLRIEIQLRSEIQHAWATAVETVDAFTRQALKSNVGKDSWKRFFSLVSTVFALMEDGPIVPGTHDDVAQIKKELKGFQKEITLLEGFHKATETIQNKEGEVFLLQLDIEKRVLRTKGYSSNALATAQNEYLEAEKINRNNPSIQSVLVSVESFKSLRKAYPNYFMDISVFVKLVKNLFN